MDQLQTLLGKLDRLIKEFVKRHNGAAYGYAATHRYVLNVNYVGNKMYESRMRVVLATSVTRRVKLMNSRVAGKVSHKNRVVLKEHQDAIPDCLFSYEYCSTVNMK